MSVAVNPHGAEVEPGRVHARLLQELHHAMLVRTVERSLAGHDGDRQLPQIGQLPRRLLLQPAPGEVRTVGLLLPLECKLPGVLGAYIRAAREGRRSGPLPVLAAEGAGRGPDRRPSLAARM